MTIKELSALCSLRESFDLGDILVLIIHQHLGSLLRALCMPVHVCFSSI